MLQAREPDRVPLGMALILGFCVTAPLLDVAAKLAATTIPVVEITAARFVVQAALMAPAALIGRHRLALSARLAGWVALRALCLAVSTFAFVSALTVMPIADALAIAFVEPFILLVLGALIFGDAVGPRRIGACAVGFVGAVLVIRPSFAAFGTMALWPLATALFFALYMLVTRSLSREVHPVPMQFHTALFAAVLCAPFLVFGAVSGGPFAPVWPEGFAWLWLFGVGAASALSHMLMTLALRVAPAATLAPLHYVEIVSAVLLGWAVFGDLPALVAWIGIAIIVGSGLYVVHRERVTRRPVPPHVPGRILPPGAAG